MSQVGPVVLPVLFMYRANQLAEFVPQGVRMHTAVTIYRTANMAWAPSSDDGMTGAIIEALLGLQYCRLA